MNNCYFVGNLTSEPVIKSTATGRAMAMFSIACNENVVDPNTGEARQTVNYVNCTAWGAMAEYIASAFHKGKQVMVMGKFISWSRKNQDGSMSYGSGITANYVQVSPYSLKKHDGAPRNQNGNFQSGNNSQGMPPTGFEQFGEAPKENVPF